MVEKQRHFEISVALTLAAILSTELTGHLIHVAETASAGIFLLGLVPIAYAGLRAGFLAGVVNTLLLSLYVLHYSGPHEVLFENTAESWAGFAVVLALGLAMSWPMSIIRKRELRLRDALHQRSSALEARNEELTELNSALESFGYVVSHDLKEPVRAIENYLDAAREEFPREESRRFVEEAYQANRRLASMLQGLLEYSRASSTATEFRPLEIGETVTSDRCRGQYGRLFDERGATLIVEPDVPKVKGDTVLLCQLFGNLLLNAAKHNTNEKPVVRISTAPTDKGLVHLVVTDNGPGYPPEVLSRFADVPTRGAATVKGGFGLVIALRAVRRLGGRLWLTNAQGGGAQAHIELPAADAPAAAKA